MSSPLFEVWETGSPYEPSVSKSLHFTVGFGLLLVAFLLTGLFALNRSLISVPVLGVPASVCFGVGAVYMMCAVGVYV